MSEAVGSWTKAVTMGFMLSVLSLCIRYGRRPGLALGLPAPRVEPLKKLHPEKHGNHEHADGRITADERGQRGARDRNPQAPSPRRKTALPAKSLVSRPLRPGK